MITKESYLCIDKFLLAFTSTLGKQQALSHEVTWNFRLYFKTGWTSAKLHSLKALNFQEKLPLSTHRSTL